MAGRPWPSWFLVGPTGSGKTPLGDELERRGFLGRRCVHFDFGANLRRIAAAPGPEAGFTASELQAVRDSLATGALFEARDLPMIVKILRSFTVRRVLTLDSLLILNGLPRYGRQADGLADVVVVERVVYLEAGAPVIRKRIRNDPGGDRFARIDDTLEAVEQKLAVFRERTLPLIDHYRTRGVPISVIPVTAGMTADEMFETLARMMEGGGGGRP